MGVRVARQFDVSSADAIQKVLPNLYPIAFPVRIEAVERETWLSCDGIA